MSFASANALKLGAIVRLNSLRFSSSTHLSLLCNFPNRRITNTTVIASRRISSVRALCSINDPAKLDVVTSTEDANNGERTKNEDMKNNGSIKDAANMLDIRVGQILRAWKHDEADSLYVEEVDIGEENPRIICSGLVNYIPIHLLQDKKVVVLANLKPRTMRGVKSSGMLMAASDESHERVELLEPPQGSVAGDRIWFGSEEDHDNLPPPATPNQIQKKKIWEMVQPHLKSDDSCNAILGEQQQYMRNSAGVVVCPSLKNANIS